MNAKSVAISGAAMGIGEAMATRFTAAGYRVALLDIDRRGEAVAKQLADAGHDARFFALDQSDWDATEAVMTRVADAIGPLDCCVANAGVAWRASLEELDEAHWDRLMNINLRGTAQLLRCAARTMRRAEKTGALIALSSTSARLGWAEHCHYSASKAAIEGLVRGLAVELGPVGIRSNAILPGAIRTAQSLSETHSLGEAGLADAARRIPLRRVGAPEDVAGLAVFLASPDAAYINGASIVVDGGMSVASY